MKRLLVIVLMLASILAILCFSDAYAEIYTCGDYKYVLKRDGTAEIAEYRGNAKELSIPPMLEGHKVTSVMSFSFKDCDTLVSVILPDSVTTIGQSAFGGCDALTNITLPESLMIIEAFAFSSCKSLANITLPERLTTIGDSAFSNCCALVSIEFSKSLTAIGDYAFSGCESLISIALPESLKVLGDYAFADCYALASIEFPKSLLVMSYGAFESCEALTSITLPESITAIEDFAFANCTALTSVYIPAGVTTIGSFTFDGCPNFELQVINYSPVHHRYFDYSNLLILQRDIEANVTEADFEIIVLTDDTCEITNYIGTEANPIIPATLNGYRVASIGEYAFGFKLGLDTVTLPEGLENIAENAFFSCDRLWIVYVPDSVTSIASNAFPYNYIIRLEVAENSYAHTYAIKNTIPFILDEAKSSETNVTNTDFEIIALADDTCEIEEYIGVKSEVVIPAELNGRRVVSIGEDAFAWCDFLESVTLPSGIQTIKDRAFTNSDALISVSLSEGVQSIGFAAFFACDNLTKVVMPESVTKIDGWAFATCPKLILTVSENSYSHAYAINNGIPFVLQTNETDGTVSEAQSEAQSEKPTVKAVYEGEEYTLRMENTEDGWYVNAEDLATLADVKFSYSEKNQTAGFVRSDASAILYIGECIFVDGEEYVPAIEASIACGVRFCEFEGELHAERLRTPADLRYRLSEKVFGSNNIDISRALVEHPVLMGIGISLSEGYEMLGDGFADAIVGVFKYISGITTQERYDKAMNSLLDYDYDESLAETIKDGSKLLEKLNKYLTYGEDVGEALDKRIEIFFDQINGNEEGWEVFEKVIEKQEDDATFRLLLKEFTDVSKTIKKLGGYDALINITNMFDVQGSVLYTMEDVFAESENKNAAKAVGKIVNLYEMKGIAVADGAISIAKSALFIAMEELYEQGFDTEMSFDKNPQAYLMEMFKTIVYDEILSVDDMTEFMTLMPVYTSIQQDIELYYYDHYDEAQLGDKLRGAGIMYLNAALKYFKMLEFDKEIDLTATKDFIKTELAELLSYEEAEYLPDYSNEDLICFAERCEMEK